jgi:heme-degrading monooxygenase HmoA
MHVCIFNFELNGVSEDEYRGLCDELAPVFAEVPGLVTKTWLANAETGTYGGVYMWSDREAFQAFMKSELASGVMSHPAIKNFSVRDCGVLEAPSAVTHGLVGAAA